MGTEITTMAGNSILGDITADLTKLFALIPGGGTAQDKFNEFVDLIKSKAKEGALQAVPDITAKVKDQANATIKPYVIASLVLGGGGLLLGIASFARRSPSKAVSGLGSPRNVVHEVTEAVKQGCILQTRKTKIRSPDVYGGGGAQLVSVGPYRKAVGAKTYIVIGKGWEEEGSARSVSQAYVDFVGRDHAWNSLQKCRR